MPFLLTYLLKLSVGLAAVFLFYRLVLQPLTFYNWNRWFLLIYSLLCFFIPFIDISPVLERNNWSDTGLLQWVPVINETASGEPQQPVGSVWGLWDMTVLILLSGMSLMFLRLLLQFLSYFRMTKRAVLVSTGPMRVYQVNEAIAPFSFGRSVFINRELHSEAELREIIRHEFVHIRQQHSLDIIWSEVLCLVNWFNPAAWWLKKAMRQNLEFIADSKVLEHGISKKEYQYLLLKVTGNYQYSIATPFSFSSLKKRIAMMNKLQSAKVNLLRFLFILPLLALILVSFRKQIGDGLSGLRDQVRNSLTDTLPGAKPNTKGYFLKITGDYRNYEVEVRDANGKEVKRIPLTEWEMNSAHYQDLYGKPEFDPPPAPSVPPVPPAPPAPKKLPDGVEMLNVNNKKVTLTLKDGTKETYDLNVPSEKKAFEKKYGDILPEPPAAPAAPARLGTTFIAPDAAEWEINDKKATIRFKDGRKEVYDLSDARQKKEFTDKYGSPVVTATVAPEIPVVAIGRPVTTTAPAALVVIGEKGTAAEAPVIAEGRPLSTTVAPAIVHEGGGVTVTAPMAGDEAVLIEEAELTGHKITGKEDILVTITRNTSRSQLDLYIRQMKEKGIDLSYDEIEYDDNGHLVKLTGTMRSKEGRSNFVAVDFNTLTLAMVKKGEKNYFKVSVKDNRKVI